MSTVDGVFPTNAPSTSISAPAGSDVIWTFVFAPSAVFSAALTIPDAAGAVAAAAARALPFASHSAITALHASSTDPPSDRVDLLRIESPSLLKTAILLSFRAHPLPPS